MKKGLFLCLWGMVATGILHAQSWLPKSLDNRRAFRAVECQYEKACLQECREVGHDWKLQLDSIVQDGMTMYCFTFTALRDLQQAGVAVAFDQYDWTSDNYLLIPASVYNGNRQRIVNRAYATGLDSTDYYRKDLALTSNPIPQLSPEFGALSRLEVLVNNTATPAIACLKRKQKKRSSFAYRSGDRAEWQGAGSWADRRRVAGPKRGIAGCECAGCTKPQTGVYRV